MWLMRVKEYDYYTSLQNTHCSSLQNTHIWTQGMLLSLYVCCCKMCIYIPKVITKIPSKTITQTITDKHENTYIYITRMDVSSQINYSFQINLPTACASTLYSIKYYKPSLYQLSYCTAQTYIS